MSISYCVHTNTGTRLDKIELLGGFEALSDLCSGPDSLWECFLAYFNRICMWPHTNLCCTLVSCIATYSDTNLGAVSLFLAHFIRIKAWILCILQDHRWTINRPCSLRRAPRIWPHPHKMSIPSVDSLADLVYVCVKPTRLPICHYNIMRKVLVHVQRIPSTKSS